MKMTRWWLRLGTEASDGFASRLDGISDVEMLYLAHPASEVIQTLRDHQVSFECNASLKLKDELCVCACEMTPTSEG